MQRIAAYLLERRDDLQWPEARKAEGEQIGSVIERWLKGKGATSVSGDGVYAALDGSDARLRVLRAVDGDRWWRMYELSEATKEGRRFVTVVSVTAGHKNVAVFVTMEVGSVSTSITRIKADPQCPKVIRELLAQSGSWHHGASQLRVLSKVEGFDAGESLALEIQNPERTIPFVVVSRLDGKTVLSDLDERLASDLAGVANVYGVDEEASWAMTDILRKPLSCYGGAIRIYWPRVSLADDPFWHRLWTASRLRGLEGDEQFALDRIRRQVRKVIMTASAASVVRPVEFDEIRGAAARAEYAALQAKASALEELKAKASSLEEFRDIADSYAEDNDKLRQDLAGRDSELEVMRDEVKRLESDKQALIFQLGQAKGCAHEVEEVEPDAPEQDEGDRPPEPGEVRFYKKKYSTGSHDVLVRVGGCDHNAWQSAEKAEKARKGISRLVGEKNEWKRLQHCGSCTGGGMWRVEW